MTPRQDLPRTMLAVLSIGALIAGVLWILWPFLAAIIWATMIVVSTWPLMLALQAWLWGKRGLAVATMTLALLLVFVIPFSAAIGTIVGSVDEITGFVRALGDVKLPPPPDWVQRVPVVGVRAAAAWQEVLIAGPESLLRELAPYVGQITTWFIGQVGSFGLVILQFLLTVVIAAILYVRGEVAAGSVRRFARRLAGERGQEMVTLAAQAIRGVALGIVLTALVQSLLGGIGLAIAGVPFAPVLIAVMFMLAVAQIGAVPVLLSSSAWLWWKGETVWLVALLIWTAIVGTMDNVLRPILIRKGANLPLLLVFAGVLGGIVAFGLIGLFVGPVVLAVAYTLFGAWVEEAESPAPPGESIQP
jgi:predicted PurR-regulated permease PerM